MSATRASCSLLLHFFNDNKKTERAGQDQPHKDKGGGDGVHEGHVPFMKQHAILPLACRTLH